MQPFPVQRNSHGSYRTLDHHYVAHNPEIHSDIRLLQNTQHHGKVMFPWGQVHLSAISYTQLALHLSVSFTVNQKTSVADVDVRCSRQRFPPNPQCCSGAPHADRDIVRLAAWSAGAPAQSCHFPSPSQMLLPHNLNSKLHLVAASQRIKLKEPPPLFITNSYPLHLLQLK